MNYKKTFLACQIACIVQAITVNFAPLLFLTLQSTYGLRLQQITLMVTLNFLTQLTVDFLASRYADRLGYRFCIVLAHGCATVGLVGLAFFPDLFPTPMSGLLTATIIYAIGSGLIEVLNSPLAEACPTPNKEAAMSQLHSFYSWGCVITILGSTVLFRLLGIENWRWISCLWALVPLANGLLFLHVPMAKIVAEGKAMSARELLCQRVFWLLIFAIICAGAAEQAVAQWASAFAERGLQVSKTVGDLAGPCLFAVLMGFARMLHGKIAHKVPIETCMVFSAALCIISCCLISLPPYPVINLLGCGLCGFSAGVLWPGTLSIAAKRCPRGGTIMFAFLALGGDAGCSIGPTLVGFVSGIFGEQLKAGLLTAVLFPTVILAVILYLLQADKRKKNLQ